MVRCHVSEALRNPPLSVLFSARGRGAGAAAGIRAAGVSLGGVHCRLRGRGGLQRLGLLLCLDAYLAPLGSLPTPPRKGPPSLG